MTNDKLFFTVDEIKHISPVEQHLHTNFTDGENTPEEIVNYAIKKGIKRLAFTEHVQISSDWYPDFIKTIKILKEKYNKQINIITGLEAKQINLQGDIDATDEQKDLAEIVIGSVHGYLKNKECEFYNPLDMKKEEALETEIDQTLSLIKNHVNTNINVVGHPLGVYLKRYAAEVPINYWDKIITKIANNGLAFDLNHLYHQPYFNTILTLCKKHQTRLNIGSDAHSLADIGKSYEQAKKL